MPTVSEHINAFSTAGPVSRQMYDRLLSALNDFGDFDQEVKKTSIHLVRRSAFAGVSFRKQHLILTIKAAREIRDPRIFKAEQASKNRWHLELKLAAPQEIDAELLGWLREAYELCA